MLRKRVVGWTLVALAVAAALTWSLRPQPPVVDVVRPFTGPLEVTLLQEGRTRVVDRYVVSAPVAGHAQRIEYEPGDELRAGDTLAVLEPVAPATLDPRALAEARAQLARAEAGERAAVAERKATAAEAERAMQRAARLKAAGAGGAVTRDELEAAAAEATSAVARSHAAAYTAELARAEVEAVRARLAVAGGARGGANAVVVRAPIAACVLKVLHESEGVVEVGQPLVELGCRATLEIRADVLSADALQLAPGGEARVEDWGGDRPLAARIRRIEPQAFTKVSALGIEEQRVWVVLDLVGSAAEWQRLGDDYRVMVRFLRARDAAVLQVPASAVFEHQGQAEVFVVDAHDRLETRRIATGLRNPGFVAVKDGLAATDRVVAHPLRSYADGQRVSPRATRTD